MKSECANKTPARPSAQGQIDRMVARTPRLPTPQGSPTDTGKEDGLLFPEMEFRPDSLESIIHELLDRGIIEVFPQPEGKGRWRIVESRVAPVAKAKNTGNQPSSEIAQRVAAIFRRRLRTLWSNDEVKAFKALEIDPEDLKLVEEYYQSESRKPESYCRTSILTFLRHYPGEVDRARRWQDNAHRKHSY